MTHTPHELADQFPDKTERIYALKESNMHFRRLSDDYRHLNREIHRGETDVEPMDDFRLEDLKKQRLLLLDEIAVYLHGD